MKVEQWDQHQAEAMAPATMPKHVGPERSGARSAQPTFPHLLAEARQQLHAAVPGDGAMTAHGRRTIHRVRSGDTLSQIVMTALQQAGKEVSRGAIYRAVSLVARANRIGDLDHIHHGQAIDLSVIVPAGLAKGRVAGAAHDDPLLQVASITGGLGPALKEFFGSLAGRFTSTFGPRTRPLTGSRDFHAGVDIALPAGSLIYPALPGRVVFSGWSRGFGNLVVLAHADGLTTSYAHNSANLIPAGVAVEKQMPIAVVGATGRATGPHLHFEVRRDGQPIDPVAVALE